MGANMVPTGHRWPVAEISGSLYGGCSCPPGRVEELSLQRGSEMYNAGSGTMARALFSSFVNFLLMEAMAFANAGSLAVCANDSARYFSVMHFTSSPRKL